MGSNIVEKILKSHLVVGNMKRGEEIGIRIDQTLTQDSTGTMAYLQFEALQVDKVKTKKSVAYVDHNMLQTGPENADDHKYIQTVAKKYGIYFSKPGNGICHQVHLERFGIPGDTLIGSDSHTPTAGGIGMIGIGAGGVDVAVAMGGGEYYIKMPSIIKVELKGKLNPWVSAKDIILEILRRVTVKGGVDKIFEYSGDGVKTLSVPERATITNMGAELGVTTSIFPSDEVTLEFLKAQGREKDFKEIKADKDALYEDVIEINLSELEPMIACPYSPDNVMKVSDVKRKKVNQVTIGSCTNSSYIDMMKVAKILEGNTIHEDVSLVIGPGSKQVLNMLAESGALSKMISSGARILEVGCGPCIGMGQAPANGAISLRTINRNFKGRCGTKSAGVYLVSPEVAAVSALTGYITDPREFYKMPSIKSPKKFLINDNLVISPAKNPEKVEIVRGPNIKSFPRANELKSTVKGKVLIKVGDNITTDHIIPSDARLLPFRSNIPHLANYCLVPCNEDFPKRAKENNGGFIISGENYGQGSSREHAALVPLYLGIKAVCAKSFARIHKANLINNGIMPLEFIKDSDYDSIDEFDEFIIENTKVAVESGKAIIKNVTKNKRYNVRLKLSEREKNIILKGGIINSIKCSNI
ncbi:aconitate hydratase [Clostridium botulinum]|uniref:Aconitate hydratase n=1 Tax=Clostridium botulinum TaxID=1491 RepID=A0A9Q1UXW5_CLOBO|nr:aconitate hydratase [Clostridium botulinum]AEB76570.1 putative aconitate hydratase [Clostridium botulinum BKT015925]KEH97406.1 aconitate hydratase [Clostridium botulinum D str. 16868]KEI04077.1 aconitate hydratase [Clostridium botulinum C/D str. Sp77]KLU76049.1 aconitate hydratase [Clostridium botulinum V891]KOA74223.1 aconitate hydratase [Clostridium botulinum]